jgi:hypothetical protein
VGVVATFPQLEKAITIQQRRMAPFTQRLGILANIVLFRSDKPYLLKNLYIFNIMTTFFLLLTTFKRGRYACDSIPSSQTEDASLEEKVP